MNKKNIFVFIAFCFFLTGCIAGDPSYENNPAGFFHGLWHGMIVWITFFVSLFHSGVDIYELNNVGGWYDFGFILGAGGSSGGCSSACTRRN